MKRPLVALFVVAFAAGYVRAGSNTGTTAGGSAVTVTSGTIAATQSGSWTLACTGPLTDTQLRASAVPVSLAASVAVTGPITDTQIRATPLPISGTVTTSGTATVSGTVACTGPLTDTQLRATPVPVSGTVGVTGVALDATLTGGTLKAVTRAGAKGATAAADMTSTAEGADHQAADVQIYSGGVAVSPLTDTQIRATALPVSGTVTCSGPLTDTQIRATALPVSGSVTCSGPLTDTQIRATALPVSGPATDTQLRATPLPVSGTVTANQGGSPWAENITQFGGTTLVNGGLAGTLAMGGTAANNASITQKPLLIGAEALSTQPVAATTGNQRQLVASLDGALYTRPGGPVPWTCSLDNIGATLTQCQAAPASGLKLYITDISIQSTTATLGLFLIRYGTGTNCGTGTTSLLPSAATVPRLGYPANTVSVGDIHYTTPLSAAAADAVCIICTATNTCTVQMSGYTAP